MQNKKSTQPFEAFAAAFNNTNAAAFIGLSPISLKISRTTGLLCGIKAPRYKKLDRKIIYMKRDLEKWLDDLPTFNNSAEALEARK